MMIQSGRLRRASLTCALSDARPCARRRTTSFPDVPDGVTAFSERDARALHFAVERVQGTRSLSDLEHQVRVVSAVNTRHAAFSQ